MVSSRLVQSPRSFTTPSSANTAWTSSVLITVFSLTLQVMHQAAVKSMKTVFPAPTSAARVSSENGIQSPCEATSAFSATASALTRSPTNCHQPPTTSARSISALTVVYAIAQQAGAHIVVFILYAMGFAAAGMLALTGLGEHGQALAQQKRHDEQIDPVDQVRDGGVVLQQRQAPGHVHGSVVERRRQPGQEMLRAPVARSISARVPPALLRPSEGAVDHAGNAAGLPSSGKADGTDLQYCLQVLLLSGEGVALSTR